MLEKQGGRREGGGREGRIREGGRREGCIVYKERWEKGRLYSV